MTDSFIYIFFFWIAKPTLSIMSNGILKSSLLITEEDSTETLNCIANGGNTPITLIWKINNVEIKRQTFITANDNQLQQNLSLTFVSSVDVKNITCTRKGPSVKSASSSLEVITFKQGTYCFLRFNITYSNMLKCLTGLKNLNSKLAHWSLMSWKCRRRNDSNPARKVCQEL